MLGEINQQEQMIENKNITTEEKYTGDPQFYIANKAMKNLDAVFSKFFIQEKQDEVVKPKGLEEKKVEAKPIVTENKSPTKKKVK